MYDVNAGLTNQSQVNDLAMYSMLRTFTHEFVHFIEKHNATEYEAFRDLVFEDMREKGTDPEDLIDAYMMEHPEATHDEASREVVAEAMTDILPESQFIQKLAQKNPGIFKNLLERLKAFIKEIKDHFAHMGDTASPEVAAAKEDIDGVMRYAEKIVEAFDRVAVGAVENYQNGVPAQKNTAGGGVQYRAQTNKYDYANSFAVQLNDYRNGKIPKGDTLIVGPTPEVFRKIGMPALPVTLNTTHVDYALNGTKDFDHHLGEALLSQLPEAIKAPVAIMTSGTKSNSSIVVMLEIRHNGKQIVVPVAVNGFGKQNGLLIDSNAITSVYGKNRSLSRVLYDAIDQEMNGKFRLYYLDKNKATALLQKARVPMPKISATHNGGFIHSLTDLLSPVKPKMENAMKSQQFKRWFGDWQNYPEKASKVVNDDGSPKIMYHGSPAQFTIFDKKKARSSGLYGRGFYFTDSQSHADTYGQQYSVYLNIKNPLKHGDTTVSRAQVRKFLESVAENEDYSIENYGTYDVDDVLEMVMGSDPNVDAFKLIQDINATAIGDMVEATELFNQVNGTKFDGIVVDTETVAFYPNQIKSATDNIGTFDGSNLDIRYQRRTATLSNRMILEKAAQSVDGQKLTPGQRSALNIFQSHLDELRKLEDKKAEQQKIIQEARAKGAKPVDYQAAVNRRNILSSQIRRETAKLLGLENTAVLRRVLEQSKKVIVDEQTAERSWVLTMLGLLQICAFLVLVVTAEFVQK